MSLCRRQALISAPPRRIWELVGEPRHHPQWWPRVVEVRGELIEEGSEYAQVTRTPTGQIETTMRVEKLDDLHEIHMRCLDTGTYAHWLLTEARGETFVEVEFGMDPVGLRGRFMDATFGRLYFRRWLDESLNALEEVVAEPARPGA